VGQTAVAAGQRHEHRSTLLAGQCIKVAAQRRCAHRRLHFLARPTGRLRLLREPGRPAVLVDQGAGVMPLR
jgi:hypothetical protein